MNSDSRLWVLIARKLSGEASPAEILELQAHLGENASDQYLFEMLNTYWMQHPELEREINLDSDKKFNRILAMGNDSGDNNEGDERKAMAILPVTSHRWGKWAWAASIAAMLVVGITYLNIPKKQDKTIVRQAQSSQNEVLAKRGTRSKIILPDGSQVWLNADSKLTYPNSFSSALREVNLEGEGFFDVVKDAKHPFVVHTSGIDIKVLGTAFNVKSYQQDPTIETTLLRGMIEVTTREDSKSPKLILKPNEKLVFRKLVNEMNSEEKAAPAPNTKFEKVQDSRMVKTKLSAKPDSVIRETSWIYNKLVFDGETLEEVGLKMERWYNVKITIHDEKLRRFRTVASFRNETIQEAMDALKTIAKFDYTMDENNIDITNAKVNR